VAAVNELDRWRLVLGRYAGQRLEGAELEGAAARMDRALEYLYGREYEGRGLRPEDRSGSLDPSQLTLVTWLNEVRELFPQETVEVVEQHALDRYGLTELVTDPQILQRLEPNQQLLKTLLGLRGHLKGEVLETARRIIRQVVEEIRRKLEAEVRPTLSGRLNRFRHSPMSIAQNFDALGTLKANLRHFSPERKQLVIEQARFFERNSRRLPWDVVLCVDQSGSMADSVIHSAVMAGILAGLPALRVSLVVFDTSVVDLSGYVDDPAEVLMSVQLGGGTDIAGAIAYCQTLFESPHRTILVVVSDFFEGGPPARLVAAVRQCREAGVRVLGLAALDPDAAPAYDKQMAERLVAAGAEIAALTPLQLAEWLIKVIR
jgi:Mg-chelatase subunit ChlD